MAFQDIHKNYQKNQSPEKSFEDFASLEYFSHAAYEGFFCSIFTKKDHISKLSHRKCNPFLNKLVKKSLMIEVFPFYLDMRLI